MPVTLLHQWEDRDNTMTKNPNAGENFEADWMNDFSFPVSFLISWVKTRHKLAHRLGARFVCVCSVERTAAFLFHIGCRMNICSCGCERWKCCRKISKWTVALILFTEWFPERKQGIFFQKMNYLLRKYWYYRASYKYMLNFVKRNKKLPHTQEEPEKNEWLIGETQNKNKSLHLFLNLNFDTSGTHTFKKNTFSVLFQICCFLKHVIFVAKLPIWQYYYLSFLISYLLVPQTYYFCHKI